MSACGFTGDPGMSSAVASRVHCLPLLPGCRPYSGTAGTATATRCYLLCTILPLEPCVCHLLQSFVCDILSLALHLLAAGLRTGAPFHEEVLSGRSREMLGEELDSNYSGFCCQ